MKRLAALFLVVLMLAGCTPKDAPAQEYIFCMDTVMALDVWGKESAEAAAQMRQLLYDLEKTWSASDESSLISAKNRGENIADAEALALLEAVRVLSERTGGAFDPALYAVTQVWGFPTDEFRIPSDGELAEARKLQLWDLGAAVKGYAGDRLVALLESHDVDRAMLNLGGNVQTYGEKADGTPWQIAIQNPQGGTLGILSVAGTMAIVTSGDYQRYFEKDGIRYHHIIDPATGMPADSGLRSVTILCRDGLTADALSTALFVMGLQKGSDFWRQSDDFEAVFITTEGKVYATEGVAFAGCEYEVIAREN
jgi:thiamine biosynthesis lipoprotein